MKEKKKKFENIDPKEAEKNVFKVLLSEEKDEVKKLVYELEIYKFELEMQNDELKETQNKLQEAKAGLQELFDFAPVGYLVLDEDGVVKNANIFICKKLGLIKENLIGTNFHKHVNFHERDDLYKYLRSLFNNSDVQRAVLNLETKAGPQLKVLLNGVRINNDNDKKLCRVILTDITEVEESGEDHSSSSKISLDKECD